MIDIINTLEIRESNITVPLLDINEYKETRGEL